MFAWPSPPPIGLFETDVTALNVTSFVLPRLAVPASVDCKEYPKFPPVELFALIGLIVFNGVLDALATVKCEWVAGVITVVTGSAICVCEGTCVISNVTWLVPATLPNV